ncbi:unnamed protein product [Adineta ricciae]|uniref:Uncharacterized protein n=1 Tax=Adineta ricciae TaxID=249248 RepID=A0A815PDC4_ADIRI|nr:unnamed protein product [Adineta ricciae]
MGKPKFIRVSIRKGATTIQRTNQITPKNNEQEYRKKKVQRISNNDRSSKTFSLMIDTFHSSSTNIFKTHEKKKMNDSHLATLEDIFRFHKRKTNNNDNNRRRRRLNAWWIFGILFVISLLLIAIAVGTFFLITLIEKSTTSTGDYYFIIIVKFHINN